MRAAQAEGGVHKSGDLAVRLPAAGEVLVHHQPAVLRHGRVGQTPARRDTGSHWSGHGCVVKAVLPSLGLSV